MEKAVDLGFGPHTTTFFGPVKAPVTSLRQIPVTVMLAAYGIAIEDDGPGGPFMEVADLRAYVDNDYVRGEGEPERNLDIYPLLSEAARRELEAGVRYALGGRYE
jgi:hypothetical protein